MRDEYKRDFFICLFCGWAGVHKFLKKNNGMGIFYLCTLGLFGIGWIYDSIKLYNLAFKATDEELAEDYKIEQQKLAQRVLAQEKQRIINQQRNAQILQAQQLEMQRIQTLRQQGVPMCPKCHSTSIHYIENRKRLSLGRTVVGGVVGTMINPVAGVAGAAMGGLTSNKQKKGTIKCLNCGYTWKI